MSDYMHVIHQLPDGSLLVILDGSTTFEHRGRRIGDRIAFEVWQRVQSVDLSAESVSALHSLAERRLPLRTPMKGDRR
jgi:hypothetical protein